MANHARITAVYAIGAKLPSYFLTDFPKEKGRRGKLSNVGGEPMYIRNAEYGDVVELVSRERIAVLVRLADGFWLNMDMDREYENLEKYFSDPETMFAELS